MTRKVHVGTRAIAPDPRRSIGKGGEADVYDIGGDLALKLFKGPGHPDLTGDSVLQAAARQRLDEIQEKLPAFPRGLPGRVVAPLDLARDRQGRIAGYTMRKIAPATPFLKLCEPSRLSTGPSSAEVTGILSDIHRTLLALHARQVIVGDVNDLNLLVTGAEAHLIDADSFQYGGHPCRMYTEEFLDPLRCGTTLTPVREASADSDWYAFTVLLTKALLFLDPYGGVYRPADPARRVAREARPAARITFFHPDVRYPRPARHFRALPDDLLAHLEQVLVHDHRGPLPPHMLASLTWTRCACGLEHARERCPACTPTAPAPAAVAQSVSVRGRVTCTRLSSPRGRLLAAGVSRGRVLWLEERGGGVHREDGREAFRGSLGASSRVLVSAGRTAVATGRTLLHFRDGKPPERLTLDPGGPSFALSDRHLYWLKDGILWRDSDLGPERVGEVLAGQTAIWAGDGLGFGLSRAGELCIAFVFGDACRGLYDRVALPRLRGELVAAHAVMAPDRIWFLSTTREAGREAHRAVLLAPDGAMRASAEAPRGGGSFLDHGAGACASGAALFVPTDDGIVRVEADGATLRVTRTFPDTEPFVHAGCRLLAGGDGLHVVDGSEIRHLRIDP